MGVAALGTTIVIQDIEEIQGAVRRVNLTSDGRLGDLLLLERVVLGLLRRGEVWRLLSRVLPQLAERLRRGS